MTNFYTRRRDDFGQLLPIFGIISMLMLVILVASMLFFIKGKQVMEDQLKDKLRDTAAAASMQFDGKSIEHIQSGATLGNSTELRETVSKLQSLRDNITNIRFAYIMRHTKNPMQLAFVAEADMGLTTAQLDTNKNGIVDPDEVPSNPGELYDISAVPALQERAFLRPSTDEKITKDQWGSTISGYAPIKDGKGQVVAILGIDMSADDFIALTRNAFSPIALLLSALAILSVSGGILVFLWKRRVESIERMEIERSGLLRLAFHQLGGPLTIINWSMEELQDEGTQSVKRTIANVQEGVKRLTKILKTLKDADLVHAGKIEYKPEFSSLTNVLQEVVRDAGIQLASRRQHAKLELTESITMRLDPKLIAGVAQELLTNAIDFSPDGSTIIVRSRQNGSVAEFEIEDSGCGIPKRDLDRLFNEFTRGSNATKFKADGNGLGLYIVRGIVERAGGKVIIRSREGKGTTVTVRLPIT